MKKYILLAVLLYGFIVQAQQISLHKLDFLANKPTWEEVGKALGKHWTFERSFNERVEYQTVEWAYKKNKDGTANMWLVAYILDGKVWGVCIKTNDITYRRLIREAEENGFKKFDTEVITGGTAVIYTKKRIGLRRLTVLK